MKGINYQTGAAFGFHDSPVYSDYKEVLSILNTNNKSQASQQMIDFITNAIYQYQCLENVGNKIHHYDIWWLDEERKVSGFVILIVAYMLHFGESEEHKSIYSLMENVTWDTNN
ncbi:hypothetical protein ACJX0J_025522, partial [Zea mays]